jgi:hypothetical protein
MLRDTPACKSSTNYVYDFGGKNLANVFGVKNAPPGVLEWAAKKAVSIESDAGWLAQFHLD